MIRAMLMLGLLAPVLAACSGSSARERPESATRPTATRPQAVRTPVPREQRRRLPPPPAQVQLLPGVDGVIGASAADLLRQFGPARLDVREGDARKLQFSSSACVLDVFLYPAAAGREPQASYVDARRPDDGKDVERPACIAALRRR